MTTERASSDHLLTPADVAARVYVDPKTVSRWARAGKIPSQRTPGGHRRFRSSDVDILISEARTHLSDGVPADREVARSDSGAETLRTATTVSDAFAELARIRTAAQERSARASDSGATAAADRVVDASDAAVTRLASLVDAFDVAVDRETGAVADLLDALVQRAER